ncbi:hypothetical protein OK016_02455 [Vibrio chagasii]|nr:hypothetical protein [Vibrio chagasii]
MDVVLKLSSLEFVLATSAASFLAAQAGLLQAIVTPETYIACINKCWEAQACHHDVIVCLTCAGITIQAGATSKIAPQTLAGLRRTGASQFFRRSTTASLQKYRSVVRTPVSVCWIS